MGDDTDPRPLFRRALDQAEHQVHAVRKDELGEPTPCVQYDVRALLGHLVAVLRKLARAGTGANPGDVPAVVTGVADDGWPGEFARARAEVDRVWADAARLDQPVTLPWATLPGRVALAAYTHEFTAHSWDLAHATGRLDRLDPRLAEHAIDGFATFAPPTSRDERGPFGPVVPVSADADPYTRLAAYLGRPVQ